jgi:branched-chain amino acid transport system substrate-binding protein
VNRRQGLKGTALLTAQSLMPGALGLGGVGALISSFSAQAKLSGRYVGLSLPMTGVQAEVGKDLEIGYQLALMSNNSDLGLLVLDDNGDAARTATNVKAFASNPEVIVLSGVVGTAHAQAAIPVARAGNLPVVGMRSGAVYLRDGLEGVFHLRASYEQELDQIAKMCEGMGLRAVAIIHSDDPFGMGSRKHLESALKLKGIAALPPMPVARDGSNMVTVTEQCAEAVSVQGVPSGVVLLMISKPMSEAAKQLREKHKIYLPMIAMSFTATKSISSDVIPHLTGMGLVSAFPLPTSSISELCKQFRKDCMTFKMPDQIGSLTTLEGYVYGSVIAKTGAQTRDQVIQRMNTGVRMVDFWVKPDKQKVGYRYLEVVIKSSDGRLKS